MVKKRRSKNHLDTDDVEPKENLDLETEDIYDDNQREEMLEDDEITAAENAFMEGREMKPPKEKMIKKAGHDDDVSVELAKKEYEED